MGRVRLPGRRDLTATLDAPDGADACVVACPPHPEYGGSRSDHRVSAVADALGGRAVACLRFDYGPWDEGRGERRDAADALDWARERYASVALFGYSFGGAVALAVAVDRTDLGAVAVLAPVASLEDGTDAADAVGSLTVPTLVAYGERDETVDWERVVEQARESGHAVESVGADHRFVGAHDRVATTAAEFLSKRL